MKCVIVYCCDFHIQ